MTVICLVCDLDAAKRTYLRVRGITDVQNYPNYPTSRLVGSATWNSCVTLMLHADKTCIDK